MEPQAAAPTANARSEITTRTAEPQNRRTAEPQSKKSHQMHLHLQLSLWIPWPESSRQIERARHCRLDADHRATHTAVVYFRFACHSPSASKFGCRDWLKVGVALVLFSRNICQSPESLKTTSSNSAFHSRIVRQKQARPIVTPCEVWTENVRVVAWNPTKIPIQQKQNSIRFRGQTQIRC